MSSLSLTNDKLRASRQIIRQRWREVQQVWNDSESWKFEQDYVEPLDQQAAMTTKELERLAAVIDEARRRVR
jgi:Tfp pilus assembly protein PilN